MKLRSSILGVAACAWCSCLAACPVGPPVLGRGPERVARSPEDLPDPGAFAAVLVAPRALLAGPLGDAAAEWFEATPEEASRGGPASWFRGLGGAERVVVAQHGVEDEPETTIAVRGGDGEGRVLAERLAGGANLRGVSIEERACGDVRLFAAGTQAAGAFGADLFLAGPVERAERACARAAGEVADGWSADPEVAALLARLGGDAQLAYVGRVPAPLRPRLQHWGLDPLVDRRIGAAAAIGEATTRVRLVAELGDEAQAAALAVSAADGVEFAAGRRSFQAAGLSPLIRRLVPRSEGRFFFLEGELPTPVVAGVLSALRTIERATGEP
ncbi:MAG: hypothetical protein GYA57_17440 [Myxococcales bacterium]|nr:hypothetical protein [Myxococcales bacterium]